ncbi:TPA: tyrosine-type recombinase/integrase [Enterococcus faecalis]
MAIRKTKNGSYKVEVFYPKDFRQLSNITSKKYTKTWKEKKLAVKDEKEILKKINKVLEDKNARSLQSLGTISFKHFYKSIWWDMYISGASGRSRGIPTLSTQSNTKHLFNNHLLPMFGEYSLNYLNDNKKLVLKTFVKKSHEYSNIKALKSYFNQLFEVAELLEYIEYNRLSKVIQYVGQPKKDKLKQQRILCGEALTAEELVCWLTAIHDDFNSHKLPLQDYLLLLLTINLGDRKSETYALQWKHIDFEKKTVSLVQTLDKEGNITLTKGKKRTVFQLPHSLLPLLKEWQQKQTQELEQLNIRTSSNQFLFTYTTRKNEMNVPVHIDYLNYRMKSIQRRHSELAHATPHKLRHTFATLAKEGGATMAEVSQALTHSDIKTTEIYVNTSNVVSLSTHEAFERRLDEARKAK